MKSGVRSGETEVKVIKWTIAGFEFIQEAFSLPWSAGVFYSRFPLK